MFPDKLNVNYFASYRLTSYNAAIAQLDKNALVSNRLHVGYFTAHLRANHYVPVLEK